MAYSTINFKTKKAFKLAVMEGKEVRIFSPGPFPVADNGNVCIEGPHYPEAHKWYASCTIENGIIKTVK